MLNSDNLSNPDSTERLLANEDSNTFMHDAFDLTKTAWRFMALILASLLLFGSHYCLDNPAAVQEQIEEAYKINAAEYNLLYSSYSLPNIILVLVGGFFIDKVGMRIGITIFNTLLCVGQAMFAISAIPHNENYWLAISARFVFGIGGESLNVAQSAIMSHWFKGKELAFALGINITFGRLGSVLGNVIQPIIFTRYGNLEVGFWIGFGICILSFIAGIFLCILDKYAEKNELNADGTHPRNLDKVVFKDLFKFKTPFWLIVASCVAVYVAIIPWNGVAPDYLQERFGLGIEVAGPIASLTYLIAALVAPIMGFILDRLGKRTIGMAMSTMMCLSCHVYLALLTSSEQPSYWCVGALTILGFGYGLYVSALWPSIPYIVKTKTIGTAFGMCTALQNIGLSLTPYIIGVIVDQNQTYYTNGNPNRKQGYIYVSWFIAAFSLVGLLFGIALIIFDLKHGRILHSSNPQEAYKRLMMETDSESEITETELVTENSQKGLTKNIAQLYLSKLFV